MSKIKKVYITLIGVIIFVLLSSAGIFGILAQAEENSITINLNGGFIIENSTYSTEDFTASVSGDYIELTHENVLEMFKNGENYRYIYGLAKDDFRGKTPSLTFHKTGVINITGESVWVNEDGTYLPVYNKVIPGGVLFGLFIDENSNGVPDESEKLYRYGDMMPVSVGMTISCYYETNMYFRSYSETDAHSKVELVDAFIEKPVEDIELISIQDLQPLQSDLVRIGNAAFNEPGVNITYIEFPETVKEIGDWVFRLTGLKKITGYKNLENIGVRPLQNMEAPSDRVILSENIYGLHRDCLYWGDPNQTVVIVFTGDVSLQGYDGDNYTFLCRDGLSVRNPLGNMKQYIYVPYGQTKNYYPTYETYVATMKKEGHVSDGSYLTPATEWRFNTDDSGDYLKIREYHEIVFDLNGGNIDGKTSIEPTQMDARAVSVMGRGYDNREKKELNLRGENEVLRQDVNHLTAKYTLPNEAAQDLSLLKALRPQNPEKEGQVFVGWKDQNDVLWTDEDWEQGGRTDTTYGKTVTLTAVWADPATVKIVSNTQQQYEDRILYVGAKLDKEILPDPDKINYKVFVGWYDTADFSGEMWNFDTDVVSGDMTLYACWDNATYHAKLFINGGTVCGKTSDDFVTVDFKYGEGEVIPVPERNGYSFDGWYENNLFTGEKVTNFSKTLVSPEYYAKWTELQITKKIEYILYGGTNASGNKEYYIVGEDTYLEEPTKEGFKFDGWYLSDVFIYEDQITNISKNFNTDIVLYAKFIPLKKYVVQYFDCGDGKTSDIYYEGQTLLLEMPQKDGYEFAGWYIYSDFVGEPIISLYGSGDNSEINLYAKWMPIKTSKINYDLSGAKLSDNAKASYRHGEVYYLPVPTKEGYKFIGWYTTSDFAEGTEISYIDANRDSDINVYACFEKISDDSINSSANGEKNYVGLMVFSVILIVAVTAVGTYFAIRLSHKKTNEQTKGD